MPLFEYTACDEHGRHAAGTRQATDSRDLRAVLKADNLYLLSASETPEPHGKRTRLGSGVSAIERGLIVACVFDVAFAVLASWGTWSLLGYGLSAAPSPGEAGAAAMVAALLWAGYGGVWLLALAGVLLLRRVDKRRGRLRFSWPLAAFMLVHPVALLAVSWPFGRNGWF